MSDRDSLAENLLEASQQLHNLAAKLVLEEQQNQLARQKMSSIQLIDSSVEFGLMLSNRRRELGVDYETLELQTHVSISTLKRVFKDPDAVRFSTVRTVCDELGIKLCSAM